MAQRKKPDALSFEEALRRLEEIVARLESGEEDLDRMIDSFEEGVQLVRICNQRLDAIERRIEQLVQKEGRETVEPLPTSEDEPQDGPP